MHKASWTASERELIAAYETLNLDVRASEMAIKLRYHELARAHRPDRWLDGSREQTIAIEQMRVIDTAYNLIRDAPLQRAPGGPVLANPDKAEGDSLLAGASDRLRAVMKRFLRGWWTR